MMSRVFRALPYLTALLLVAGLVHVAIILLAPRVSAIHAHARMTADAQVNVLEQLPPVREGERSLPTPFADPAMVTALCRFDLTEGPVRVRVATGDTFLSVSILGPNGRVLTSMTDKAATRRQLNIVLLTAEQQRQLESQDPDDEPVQDLRIRLQETRGVALIRGLALREADKGAMAAALARTLCRQE
jgi:uncharacterized membrane protein